MYIIIIVVVIFKRNDFVRDIFYYIEKNRRAIYDVIILSDSYFRRLLIFLIETVMLIGLRNKLARKRQTGASEKCAR